MKFFKKYLFYIISIALSILFLALGFLSRFFVVIALVFLCILSIIATIQAYKRYKSLEDYHESDDYFDATKLDYDEDIYYLGGDKKRTEIKSKIGKMNAFMPTIILGFMALAFAIMALYVIFKF